MKLVIARTLLSLLLLPPVAVVAQSQNLAASAQDGVRIGTLTYQPGQDGIVGYYVVLDGARNLQFGSAVLHVKGVRQASGAFTGGVGLLYIGGPDPYALPSCAVDACVSISLHLLTVDGKPMTLKLTNRKTFTTWGVNTVTMQALPGQTIVPGQSVAIILMADPKGL